MKPNELELEALRRFKAGEESSAIAIERDADETLFALVAAMEVMAKARDARFRRTSPDVDSAKRDVVAIQSEIRNHVVQALKGAMPDVTLLAEDAGAVPAVGATAVLDAIDGTSSYVTHGEATAVTFTLFDAGEPKISFVANPATGEIAYADGSGSRLIQLPFRGAGLQAAPLPLAGVSDDKPLLVSIHAFRNISAFVQQFYGSWSQHHYDIHLIKAYSGSPSWALVEAAKGHFVYINVWDQGEAVPQDLASGLHILRSAGGDAVRASGEPIPASGHRGAFIAAAHDYDRDPVIEIVNVVKANADLAEGLI
jgi:fructose-1,6-bisphosphatase/inositol monophosphatase family enzyme